MVAVEEKSGRARGGDALLRMEGKGADAKSRGVEFLHFWGLQLLVAVPVA